jgi:hypothetical protein
MTDSQLDVITAHLYQIKRGITSCEWFLGTIVGLLVLILWRIW